MPNVHIQKPEAGQRVALTNLENSRLVLAFPASDATLERAGDDLIFTFDDGSQVSLEGFYTTYTSDNLPTFEIEGAEVTGKDFFAALGEDLMPAAGPAAPAAVEGGRYNEFDNASLMDGIDRLDGLDVGFSGSAQATTDPLGGLASLDGLDGTAVAAADVVTAPVTPVAPVTPTQPEVPPTQPEVPPTQPDVPPTEPEVPPTEPEIPPTQPDVPPTEPDVPPTPPPFVPKVTIHATTGTASLENGYGYYIKDATGEPLDGKLYVIWDNVKMAAPGEPFTLEGYTPDQLGFFLVPGGAGTGTNKGMNGTTTGAENGYLLYDANGAPLDKNGVVIFDNSSLNPENVHNFVSVDGKHQFWEDQKLGVSDWNMDDVRIRLEYNGWEEQPDSLGAPYNKTYDTGDGGKIMYGGVSANDHDELAGTTGNDVLVGHRGNDTLSGDAGNDRLYGGWDNDTLDGGEGDDYLNGGAGDDLLFGDSGDDLLFGDSGNDYLDGGAGADKINGGKGHDLIKFDAADLFIDGGADLDVLLGGVDDLMNMKDMLRAGTIDNVELLVSGANMVGLTDMDALYKELGITRGADGKLDLGTGWAGGSSMVLDASNDSYLEFSNNDGISIIVQESIIKSETGAA